MFILATNADQIYTFAVNHYGFSIHDLCYSSCPIILLLYGIYKLIIIKYKVWLRIFGKVNKFLGQREPDARRNISHFQDLANYFFSFVAPSRMISSCLCRTSHQLSPSSANPQSPRWLFLGMVHSKSTHPPSLIARHFCLVVFSPVRIRRAVRCSIQLIRNCFAIFFII